MTDDRDAQNVPDPMNPADGPDPVQAHDAPAETATGTEADTATGTEADTATGTEADTATETATGDTGPVNPAALVLAKASKLSPTALGGAALAILLLAGGIGAAVARAASKPVVVAPPAPILPPVTPSSLPGPLRTPESLPPLTPDSIPGAVPDAPGTTAPGTATGAVKPAPITRPPNAPRPTSGIPTGGALPPADSGGLPSNLPGGGAEPSAGSGGLPSDLPGALPADPTDTGALPGGLPADLPADPGGDAGGLPAALPDSPGTPDLPGTLPAGLPGADPAGTGGGTPAPAPAPTPSGAGQPVEIGSGVSITPAAGFSVTNKVAGAVFLGSKNAMIEADVFTGAQGTAEVIVADIGRSYLPQNVSNLQFGQPQISQSNSADVLSFASSAFQGVMTGTQGSFQVEGAVFVAIRQDRTALVFIAMYEPGAWEQLSPAFGAMFGSMLTRS